MPWSNPATHSTGYKATAADWNEVINDLKFLAEIGYQQFTSNVTSSATTVGTAVQIISLGAITYEAVPTMLEFYAPRVATGAGQGNFVLRDGTTVLGTMGIVAASNSPAPIYMAQRITPSAASHTYNVAVWVGAASTTTVNAGTGGAAGDASTYLAGWMRGTRLPT